MARPYSQDLRRPNLARLRLRIVGDPLSLHLGIAAGCSASEKAALFAGTATKFYRLA